MIDEPGFPITEATKEGDTWHGHVGNALYTILAALSTAYETYRINEEWLYIDDDNADDPGHIDKEHMALFLTAANIVRAMQDQHGVEMRNWRLKYLEVLPNLLANTEEGA